MPIVEQLYGCLTVRIVRQRGGIGITAVGDDVGGLVRHDANVPARC